VNKNHSHEWYGNPGKHSSSVTQAVALDEKMAAQVTGPFELSSGERISPQGFDQHILVIGCYHGNLKLSFLGVITHILGFKIFIFHGFGVQG